MNPLLIVGLVTAGIYAFNKLQTAGTAGRLNYRIQKLDIDLQLLTCTIYVDIGIQNATSNEFVINSYSGTLYLNNQYLGTLSNFSATRIQANSETPYRVACMISTLAIPGQVLSLIQNYSGINAKIAGTINVDNTAVPLTLEYKA